MYCSTLFLRSKYTNLVSNNLYTVLYNVAGIPYSIFLLQMWFIARTCFKSFIYLFLGKENEIFVKYFVNLLPALPDGLLGSPQNGRSTSFFEISITFSYISFHNVRKYFYSNFLEWPF